MALSRDQIINADDLKVIEVDVPEWGGKVRLRTMSGGEREAYFRRLMKYRAEEVPKDMYQTLLCICAVDDKGNPLFTFDDLPVLAKKNGAILDRLTKAAGDLNGLTDKAIDDMTGE